MHSWHCFSRPCIGELLVADHKWVFCDFPRTTQRRQAPRSRAATRRRRRWSSRPACRFCQGVRLVDRKQWQTQTRPNLSDVRKCPQPTDCSHYTGKTAIRCSHHYHHHSPSHIQPALAQHPCSAILIRLRLQKSGCLNSVYVLPFVLAIGTCRDTRRT